MDDGTREALLALQAFAGGMSEEYQENVSLTQKPKGLFSNPLDKLTKFQPRVLTAAQSFAGEEGESFLVLAHLDENSKIDFQEMEALTWLANDALVFDASARVRDERGKAVNLLFGEKVVARAIFLKCLLGGYVRALDAQIFKRMVAREEGAAQAAVPLMEKSVQEFTDTLDRVLPKMRFRAEIVQYAKAARFPIFPLSVAYKRSAAEEINGVLLDSDMARQLRAHLARSQEPPRK
jgi:hypothetical protein